MTFKTKYDDHPRFYQEPGNPIKQLYQGYYEKDGTLELRPSGEEDLYQFIQSHKDSTDINLLIQRFTAGDESALSRAQGFYADVSGMPKTFQEVLNAVLGGERAFDSLPAEVKQRFNNNFAEWLTAMDLPDFAERMGFKSPDPDPQSADFLRDSGSAPVDPGSSKEVPSNDA